MITVFRLVLGFLNVVIGLAALAWGIAVFPTFWRTITVEQMATAVVNRVQFKPGALQPLMPLVEQIEQTDYCRPPALQAAAAIRLRLAEGAMDRAERDAIDGQLDVLDHDIRRALACTPGDAFLWTVLAWLDGAREGFRNE